MNNLGAQQSSWAHEVRNRIPQVVYTAPCGSVQPPQGPQNAGEKPKSADPFTIK